MFESFYPPEEHINPSIGYDMDYETAKPFLQEYYGITEDPRELISMRQDGNSVTYTKERWIDFIHRMSPDCSFTQQPEGTYPNILGMANYEYYHKLTQWIESLSRQLPTDSIWKYLMAVKYFLQ